MTNFHKYLQLKIMGKDNDSVYIPRIWIITSIIISILITATSLFGIFFEKTYSRETYAWAIQGIGQDYANLAVVVLLLISTYFVAKHSLRAYLIWLGSYIYLIYAFVIYAFAIHFQFLFLAYVAILGLSLYTFVGGLLTADKERIKKSLRANSKSQIVSVFLMVVGILFILLWLSEIVPNLLADTVPRTLTDAGLLTNPVHVLDLSFVLPGMIIISVLLKRKNVIGCLMAVPFLVFVVTMGLGIIVMFILSALEDLPYSLPAGILIGLIMLAGTLLTYMFLKEV